MRISDWSSDVCSSDLDQRIELVAQHRAADLDHGEARRVELREALEVLADLLRAAHARKQADDGLAGLAVGLHGGSGDCASASCRSGFSRELLIYRPLMERARGGKIGRRSCRERVCQYGSSSEVAENI